MEYIVIEESPLAKFMFANPKSAWFWFIVRVYVGYEWVMAGWGKIGMAAWTGDQAGASLTGFVNGALAKTVGAHPDVQGWYAWFLTHAIIPHASLWSHVIAYGEFLVGIALILGIFTGIASFFGLFMNFNFLLAGAVSVNPILFVLQVGLMFAWRIAGWIGCDRYLLTKIGTPWQRPKTQ